MRFFGLFPSGGIERQRYRRKLWHAHADRDHAVVFEARLDQAAQGFDTDRPFVGQPLVVHKTHKAARAIPALFDFAAIAIEDAIAKVGIALRFFDNQNLIRTDTKVAVRQRLPLRAGEIKRLMNAVEHDEIGAQALHFGELQFHVRSFP